jgi:uncharacterized phage-associated protein
LVAEFNADRFREAVLYIAWRMRGNENFGRVKLAKTLFYADFESYAEEGEPVTGARYEHWERGPFPPVLYDLTDGLKSAGQAEVVGGKYQGEEERLIPANEPATPHLLPHHRTLLDLQMDRLAELPSWQVSDISHEHPAWLLTEDKEEIPYAAAHVPALPSKKAMEIAKRRFGLHGH